MKDSCLLHLTGRAKPHIARRPVGESFWHLRFFKITNENIKGGDAVFGL
jgi:hypothetical protein